MKRSEMLDHIYQELRLIFDNRSYSRETDESYYKRKAALLLDMLEGFGVHPPTIRDGAGGLSEMWEQE